MTLSEIQARLKEIITPAFEDFNYVAEHLIMRPMTSKLVIKDCKIALSKLQDIIELALTNLEELNY